MYYVANVKALNLPAVLPFAVKFTLGFPISFHVYNGIRHLVRWAAVASLADKLS